MNMSDLFSSIDILREKGELNKLVVFVGAGVSRNVPGLPSWHDLIVEMAKMIDYTKCSICWHKDNCVKRCSSCLNRDNCDQKCLISDDFSSDEYLKIPQYVYNHDETIYWDVVKKCITDNSIPNAPLSKAIFGINPSHIITTNYDRLLETSESEYKSQYDVVITDKDLLNANKSKYIIKMHGDILHPDTIVLKEQDYLEYSQKHVLMELFVKSLIADHTILFLGYSLNDYNVKLILSWINYLRTQNESISKNQKIGYIVLDEDNISNNTIDYFRNNNIEVLNIHSFPQIKNIPNALTADKGKRLYSFLSIISNPTLEKDVSIVTFMDKTVDFLTQHKIYDYKILLKFLQINTYRKIDSSLMLYDEKQYNDLIGYLDLNTKKSIDLIQIFVNTGIKEIDFNGQLLYKIDEKYRNELMDDRFFSLYIQNKYVELSMLLQAEAPSAIKQAFYYQFISDYSVIRDSYNKIAFFDLREDEKVAFLHNTEMIKALFSYNRFNSSPVEHYIHNIASSKERQIYQPYFDMYEGNTSARFGMETALEKLKVNINKSTNTFFSEGPISELYKIKNAILAHFLFYFTNYILINGFNDFSNYLYPYIEAIIMSNRDIIEKEGNILGFATSYEKYSVTCLDFDIVTKYISTKELYSLIENNNITQFRTSDQIISHLVSCASNLADSMLKSNIYGYMDSSINVLSNILLLLSKVAISEIDKEHIALMIESLYSDNTFNQHFWNVGIADHKVRIKIFAQICELIKPHSNIECIKTIVSNPMFFECIINSDYKAIQTIILSLLRDEDYMDYENDLFQIIDNMQDFNHKVLLLKFLYKKLHNAQKISEYQTFLSSNYFKLDRLEVYEFVFNGWVVPSPTDISKLFEKIRTLYYEKNPHILSFPNPLEINLEQVYLLYINDIISDISELDEMSNEYPHLQFLLHPDSFDYHNVDFSNSMWRNFARHPKFMRFFVEHKEDIIPQIVQRIKKDEANEDEKKILYGFLLSDDKIWNI